MSLRTRFLYAAVLICLSACGSVDRIGKLQPGVSTEADATKVAGRKPVYIWDNPDGTRTLDYSNQQLGGTDSWFVTVNAGGKILKTQHIVIDAYNNAVTVGMTSDQVRRILGSPRGIANFHNAGELVWEWNTITTGGPGEFVRLDVYIRNDIVDRILTRTLNRSDCDMSGPC